MWPGITPITVWDLELRDWCMFAEAADAYEAEIERRTKDAGNTAGRRSHGR